MDGNSFYKAGDKRKRDVIVLPDDPEEGTLVLPSSSEITNAVPSFQLRTNGSVIREISHLPSTSLPIESVVEISKVDTNLDPGAQPPSPQLTHSNDGRPKACEMLCPLSKKVMKTFQSCSQAEREMKISKGTIARLCRTGGGIVDGKHFQYTTKKALEKNMNQTTVSSNNKGDTDSNDCPSAKHFDVTQLQPMKSTASLKKKYVELFCKGSNKVLVCFRGNMDASNALNLDREVVIKMCQGKASPSFESFSLSYKSSKMKPSCYQYGVHEEDNSEIRETYADRVKRWEETFLREQQTGGKQNAVKNPTTTTTCDIASNSPPEHVERGNPPTKEVSVSTLCNNKIGNTAIRPESLVSVMSPDEAFFTSKYQKLCIVCQKRTADVLFQPCSHSVICGHCNSMDHCKTFCPICKTSISSTTCITHVKYVRPRIYSAYSFME